MSPTLSNPSHATFIAQLSGHLSHLDAECESLLNEASLSPPRMPATSLGADEGERALQRIKSRIEIAGLDLAAMMRGTDASALASAVDAFRRMQEADRAILALTTERLSEYGLHPSSSPGTQALTPSSVHKSEPHSSLEIPPPPPPPIFSPELMPKPAMLQDPALASSEVTDQLGMPLSQSPPPPPPPPPAPPTVEPPSAAAAVPPRDDHIPPSAPPVDEASVTARPAAYAATPVPTMMPARASTPGSSPTLISPPSYLQMPSYLSTDAGPACVPSTSLGSQSPLASPPPPPPPPPPLESTSTQLRKLTPEEFDGFAQARSLRGRT